MNGRPVAAALPPLTDEPIKLAELVVDTTLVSVWADRPTRGLTRIMLTDGDGHACGDAVLHGDTLTIGLPPGWSAAAKIAVTCMAALIVHQAAVR